MYELTQAGERSWYIQAPVQAGLYQAEDGGVYLIDSGGDKDYGRRIRKILDSQGWTLKGILNTHSNADHIGGNRYLQQQYGCPVFAGGIEGAMTKYPILEPSFLFGGYPFRALRHKLLLAEGSEVSGFDHPDFPKEIEIIPLPGHFFDMVGFKTPDGTAFLADCLCSEATLEKYQITFLYDAAAYLQTLDKVPALEARLFVPAHAPAAADIRPLAEKNREAVLAVADHIRSLCAQPVQFEELLRQLFIDYGLRMSYEQYVLVGSTVRSYLAWLTDTGAIQADIQDNRLLWRAV